MPIILHVVIDPIQLNTKIRILREEWIPPENGIPRGHLENLNLEPLEPLEPRTSLFHYISRTHNIKDK